MKNKMGPKIDPWGTPHQMGTEEDIESPIINTSAHLKKFEYCKKEGGFLLLISNSEYILQIHDIQSGIFQVFIIVILRL